MSTTPTGHPRSPPRSYDVFCRVVDNYGDAAVCWRLARSLSQSASTVRLWIDEPEVLAALQPGPAPVSVHRWTEDAAFGEPAEVAIDAFGAGLPERYAEALAGRPRSLWIVLEYLSAEPWVADRHGLPSPHPRLSVKRYFFFPGFTPGTGGLLCEAGYAERRTAFLDEALRRDDVSPPNRCTVSLFGYENAALPALLDTWSSGPEQTLAVVPASRLTTGVEAWLGEPATEGSSAVRGSLELRFPAFMPQHRYDELLWSADWNFVRGEDSFVRAQWAERPSTWQIYPQAEGAHLPKLRAFHDLYCEGLEPALAVPLRNLAEAWNGTLAPESIGDAWRSLQPGRAALRRHATRWAGRIAAQGDLAMNLARFCTERIE